MKLPRDINKILSNLYDLITVSSNKNRIVISTHFIELDEFLKEIKSCGFEYRLTNEIGIADLRFNEQCVKKLRERIKLNKIDGDFV